VSGISLPDLRNPVVFDSWRVTRYSNVGSFLLDIGVPSVTATFDELSAVVRGGLPASAYRRDTWWSNDPRDAQCLDGWGSAGYAVVAVSLTDRVVTFHAVDGARWAFSDAWVFAAVGDGPTSVGASLTEVIATGDAINHAILTEAEFTRAVPRLLAAGLIGADHAADRYWYTPAGSAFFRRHMKGRGLFGWIDAIPPALRRLGPPEDGEWTLDPGEFDRAARAWHERARRLR
jgi:hypothetical protein